MLVMMVNIPVMPHMQFSLYILPHGRNRKEHAIYDSRTD